MPGAKGETPGTGQVSGMACNELITHGKGRPEERPFFRFSAVLVGPGTNDSPAKAELLLGG
jgi:hypothetical protein